MWLVICASDDAAALWACEGIRRRGLEPLQLVPAEYLVHSICWDHRLQNGHVWTDMILPDGQCIRSTEVSGILNRITSLNPSSVLLMHPSDRFYATHEFQSFFLSWLQAMPVPVLNRPTPFGLSGRLRHISEWIWLAAKAGLPTSKYSQSSDDQPVEWGAHMRVATLGTPTTSIVVAGGVATGPPAPPEIAAGCSRLSELCETPLLGIEFVVSDDGAWTFAGANTSPDLRLGGEPLLDALAKSLNGHRGDAL